MPRTKKQKIIYLDGYNHYDRYRNIPVTFYLNEAEKAAFDDLMAALGMTNQSEFIRSQVFKAYRDMTPDQLRLLAEVAEWRASEAIENEKNKHAERSFGALAQISTRSDRSER